MPKLFGKIELAYTPKSVLVFRTGGMLCFPHSDFNNYSVYTPLGNGLPTRNTRSIFIDTTRYRDFAAQLPYLWTANFATTSPSLSGALGLGVRGNSPNFDRITSYIDSTMQTGGLFYVAGNNQEIWAYASNNYGRSQILRYNAVNGGILGYYDATNVLSGLFSNNFFARGLYCDAAGNRWITVNSEGVGVRSADGIWTKVSFADIFSPTTNNNPNAIAGNSQGDVYFGTTNGLVVYKRGTTLNNAASYTRYTTADGLPSNNILSIAVDTYRGLVWVATDNGIALWNPPFDGK